MFEMCRIIGTKLFTTSSYIAQISIYLRNNFIFIRLHLFNDWVKYLYNQGMSSII